MEENPTDRIVEPPSSEGCEIATLKFNGRQDYTLGYIFLVDICSQYDDWSYFVLLSNTRLHNSVDSTIDMNMMLMNWNYEFMMKCHPLHYGIQYSQANECDNGVLYPLNFCGCQLIKCVVCTRLRRVYSHKCTIDIGSVKPYQTKIKMLISVRPTLIELNNSNLPVKLHTTLLR